MMLAGEANELPASVVPSWITTELSTTATRSCVVASLSVPQDKAVDAIEKLQAEGKRLAREVTQLKTKMAMGGGAGATTEDTVQVNGVTLARRKVADLDKDALRGLADSLKARITSGVVVLASPSGIGGMLYAILYGCPVNDEYAGPGSMKSSQRPRPGKVVTISSGRPR